MQSSLRSARSRGAMGVLTKIDQVTFSSRQRADINAMLGLGNTEMHLTRKGNNWYFGMKANIDVEAKSG